METYVIHTTKKCNLACLYCYEQDKTSSYTLDEIKSYVDDIFTDIGENIVHIEFLGGEPLLEFNILKDSFYYIEEKYRKNVESYIITTNGTIINDDILDFLDKNKKRIRADISMDGTLFANQLRYFKSDWKNSYFTVKDNIEKIHSRNLSTSIHIVTHPFNIAYLFDSIKHLHEKMGINGFGIGTVESTIKIDENYCNEFKRQIINVADYAIENDLNIDIFQSIKPKSDVRTYVREKSTGKLIFESYGRIKNTVFDDTEKYEIIKCNEPNSIHFLIQEIREFAYNMYQEKRSKKMSLINEKNDFKEMGVKDCVGHFGKCDYVTNPKTNHLFKNVVVNNQEDFNKLEMGIMSSQENFSDRLENSCNNDDCQCNNDESSDNAVIAKALAEILIRLDNIEKKLNK